MDLEINITSTMRALEEDLEQVLVEQLPFATALAMTRTGRDCRDEARDAQAKRFKVRRSNWPRHSIRSTRADKRDWPHPHSQVGTVDEFMVLQDLGGRKLPQRSPALAIPSRAIRRTSTGRVRKSQRPSALLGLKNVWEEDGTIRRRASKRTRLSIMYFVRPSAHVEPARPTMQETVSSTFEKKYPGRFLAAYNEAIKSRRRA